MASLPYSSPLVCVLLVGDRQRGGTRTHASYNTVLPHSHPSCVCAPQMNQAAYTGFYPWVHPSRLASSHATASLDPTTSTWAMRYWSCMYWALTTMTKVPWVTPRSWPEQFFGAIAFFSGALFYAFLVGETSAIAVQGTKARVKRMELNDHLAVFKNKHKDELPAIFYWEAVTWLKVDTEFAAKYSNKEKLLELPINLRNEALLHLHADVFEPSAFGRTCTDDAVAELALLLKPRAAMAGHTVIAEGQIDPMLHMLLRGALKVQSQADAERDSTKRQTMNAARTTQSRMSLWGGGSGPSAQDLATKTHLNTQDLLSAYKDEMLHSNKNARDENLRRPSFGMKKMTRFRVIEKTGSTIGICDLDNGLVPFPFRVEATKLCHMFVVHRKAILTAFNRMTKLDEQACRAAIRIEHQKHVESLRMALEQRQTRGSVMARRQSSEQDDSFKAGGGGAASSLSAAAVTVGAEEGETGRMYRLASASLKRKDERFLAAGAGSREHDPLEEMPLMMQVVLTSGALDRRARGCHSSLSKMKAQTGVIPLLIQQLKGKAGWGAGVRRGSVLNIINPSQQAMLAAAAAANPHARRRSSADMSGGGGGIGGGSPQPRQPLNGTAKSVTPLPQQVLAEKPGGEAQDPKSQMGTLISQNLQDLWAQLTPK